MNRNRCLLAALATCLALEGGSLAADDPTAAIGCDPLDPVRCLLPFPNDYFTKADAATDTGRRLDFALAAMPRNVAGKPIDPTEWNRNDGFSPGSMILTYVPGLDLDQTGAPSITDPARSVALDGSGRPASPIVIVDALTGTLHPFMAELDQNDGARARASDLSDVTGLGDPDDFEGIEVPTKPTTPPERLLILRPMTNFREGARYVVAMRRLENAAGVTIPAGPAFTALRTELPLDATSVDSRRAHYENNVFPVLAQAGIDRADLYLAWDFTVASERSLSERVMRMRNEGFRTLGGGAPSFTASVDTGFTPDPSTQRRVTGTVTVPNFLNTANGASGSRLNYAGGDLPVQNGTLSVPFVCNVPQSSSATNRGLPAVYGHGLLGSRTEVNSGHARNMGNQGNLVFCATNWIGMAEDDIVNAVTIIADVSNFPTLADRAQQAFLNFMVLGRAMIHPQGFCTDPAFQDGSGNCLVDLSTEQLYYDGNSQGGIMGGALVALAHDVRRGVLGVTGMNYSTLLNRSVDWENLFATAFYTTYPDKMDEQITFALMNMLWDRAEADGYARHMSDDPYPDPSPSEDAFHDQKTVATAKGAKQVLLHVAYADHQVSNLAAEVEARTIGARVIQTSLYAPNHWETSPFFGLAPIDGSELATGAAGSAIVYWHNGNNPAPITNQPPREACNDPHESPRRDPKAVVQKARFYRERKIFDTCNGRQCETEYGRNCENGRQP